MNTNTEATTAFFDSLAERWDSQDDLPALSARLDRGLIDLGLTPNETVVDVGCGTGNVTRALLARLSPGGHVVAVDISRRMLEIAKAKVLDPRVTWHLANVQALPLPDASVDRVLCFGVWPHLEDASAAGREIARVLRPGGSLHIWHLISRARVNTIHATAGEAVRTHLLAPATDTGMLLTDLGFTVAPLVDDDEQYLVTAQRRTEG